MRKQIKNKTGIFPMPVLMIGTYNEDGSVDVMNAAWGTMLEGDQVILNLSENHKSFKNIRRNKAFTVSIGDCKNVKACDYLGMVSGNTVKDKFEKSLLTSIKSDNINAPIINEFPICMECELLEGESNWGIVGKIINVTALESVMNGDNVDIDLVEAIAFDPYTNGYYKVSGRVDDAFSCGMELK